MVAWIPARLPMVQFRGQTVVKRRERKMVSHSKRCVIGLLIFAGVIAGALTDPPQLGSQTAVAGSVLLKDDFNDGAADGWTISPLGGAAGWSVVDRVYTYDGGGHTQSYRGTASWTDYTLEAKIRLATLNNYPGGIRGRVDPGTGAGYAVWLYPATGEIRLLRATAWNIDSPGLTVLGAAKDISFDTEVFRTLRVTFTGNLIRVYYDGVLLIRATDTTYSSGMIALDVSSQPIEFDDVVVTYGALSELLRDDFNDGAADGWTISPLGQAAGWRVVAGVYGYDGGGHTQSYRGEPSWSDYTLEAKIRLTTLNNYPGGIRGRVNPGTGAGYAVWVYPATGEIRLVRATAWSIDSPELTVLGVATGVPFDVGAFHTLRTTFTGTAISVYYDGILALRATDTVYRSGVIALDVSNQPIEFDDVVVTYGALAQRFNSAEPGCDGSDPNILWCDDFEDGNWFVTPADKNNPLNGGWNGSPFGGPDPQGTGFGRCGGLGVAGTNCAATSGPHAGIGQALAMADHDLRDLTSVSEIYFRYYIRPLAGFRFGQEKALTFNRCCAGVGGIYFGTLFWGISDPTLVGDPVFYAINQGVNLVQNQGQDLGPQAPNWYYVELHLQLNTPGLNDGVLELWMDNCGADGRGCTSPGTPRTPCAKE